ncbi:MAG: ester cyclase [bacterium]|nr:ester cyclase [bacterium]
MRTNRRSIYIFLSTLALGLVIAGCASDKEAEQLKTEAKLVASHLTIFDDLDFRVFTGQQWVDLHRSHSNDITVFWPDGHSTKGIEKHIEDLKALFVWAPDTRIKEHPVKIGQKDWTAVIGFMEGTFTKPMPIGEGKTIPPTGKAYKIRMATIGHWNKDGVMDEEYLFWDNQDFYKQIGLGK